MIDVVGIKVYECEYDSKCWYCVANMEVESWDDIDETNHLARLAEKATGASNTGSGFGVEGRDQNFLVKKSEFAQFLGFWKSLYPDFSLQDYKEYFKNE